ncbi:HIT domain-containing protein [Natronomonas sp. CBA1123]|jgi:histidine triad (HIT) family protein|uniref:HIT family protein n=1 Tax=Natronomonas sp. CBA1123 TaxID=2668070 RepID=UPI0012E99D69|nr:HIT family protein [Natronomonas sp. CBA1123]MUV87997.1 HIT domain-containing protein [Natronomonas sp. CBA1123]
MTDCVFCDIVAGDAPAYRLHETDRTLAFLDIEPLNPGHALVVPKPHRETLTDMDADLVADTFRSARTVAEAVETAFDPDGLNLLQANGEAAGQEVFHAHVHVLPRYEDDDVEVSWPAGELNDEEATEVAEKIRDAL